MSPVHGLFVALAVAGVASLVAGISRATPVSEPLLLSVAGVGISFIPHVPEIELTPQLVLDGLLPPLLYAAAVRTSVIDLNRNRRPVLLLSVGLTAFTTLVVGLTAWAIVPAFTLATGLALGAVVAPPDAVAATAIVRRAGLPRRILTTLSGESLVNDAVALVALSTATQAMSHTVSPWRISGQFVYSAIIGIAIGMSAALAASWLRHQTADPVLSTVVSFALPYLTFLPAQALGASGVLAVVTAGLLVRVRSRAAATARSRLSDDANWTTIQFVLESSVFLLIGLQLRHILAAVAGDHLGGWFAVRTCLGVFAVVVLARAAWTFAVIRLLQISGRPSWDWRISLVVSWAGMRGVVTLAAVFLLPVDTPDRDLAALAAFAVVAGTLLLQGSTLPPLIRRLGLSAPDAVTDALANATLLAGATRAGLVALHGEVTERDSARVVQMLRNQAQMYSDEAFERLNSRQTHAEIPADTRRRLRQVMLDAERTFILGEQKSLRYDDLVVEGALNALDIEEVMLASGPVVHTAGPGALCAPAAVVGHCEHLQAAGGSQRPPTDESMGCAECLREGRTWVSLRECLVCGRIGCCDSSDGRHAARHFETAGHPVVQSGEPGETWRWCYVDQLLG